MNYEVFKSFPTLTTERMTLQSYEVTDVDDLFELRTDPSVTAFLDRHPAKDKSEIRTQILDTQKDFNNHKGINWTIKLKGQNETIGYIGFWRIDHTNHRAELGYALKKEYWRKGLMYEAAVRIINFAFDELQVHSIMANINPTNAGSEKLLLKLGFRKEAYFREDYFFDGKFLDSVIYGLLTSDWKT
ncbi:MAG: GNAT family N-acetyltransferase [Bacteroidota bacterium]